MLENTIGAMSQLYFTDKMPGCGFEAEFLYAVCKYRLGEYKVSAAVLKSIADYLRRVASEDGQVNYKEMRYYNEIYYYVGGIADGMSDDEVYNIIRTLYSDVADKVHEEFKDRMTVLGKLYPICGNKSALDITEGGCIYKDVHEFYKKIVKDENDHPTDPEVLRQVFSFIRK